MRKVSELTGALLDYWVAKAEGLDPEISAFGACLVTGVADYAPSINWAQGGPLIEKHNIPLEQCMDTWTAMAPNATMFVEADGDTPLQAICRAVVRAKFGNEVPDQPEKENA